MPRRVHLHNHRGWFLVAVVMFVAACWIFYDLYEARGGRSPLIIRMFTPT